jgi:hypothetical protein
MYAHSSFSLKLLRGETDCSVLTTIHPGPIQKDYQKSDQYHLKNTSLSGPQVYVSVAGLLTRRLVFPPCFTRVNDKITLPLTELPTLMTHGYSYWRDNCEAA